MKTSKFILTGLGLLALGAMASTARAGGISFSISIGLPHPAVIYRPPVVVAPPPVVYAPPVYVHPAPWVCSPAPIVGAYPRPLFHPPAPVRFLRPGPRIWAGHSGRAHASRGHQSGFGHR